MYRIVCESYKNYINDFTNNRDDFRYRVMQPLSLIIDLNQYQYEKQNETSKYKKLEDFIWMIRKSLDDYPSFKAFIWSLESRGIKGKFYGVLNKEEFEEQVKVMRMFFRLSYWN